MRRAWSVLIVLSAILAPAGGSAATGKAQLSWGGCSLPTITNQVFVPGQTSPASLCVFVDGQSDPTQSCQVWILYGGLDRRVPDAWRFDPAGCQGTSRVTLNHLAPAALEKSCPSFQDAGGTHTSLQIKAVGFVPAELLNYPTTMMRIVVADAYPTPGNTPDPATRYFLMDAEFDQSIGSDGPTPADQSTCGGLDQQVCFDLLTASYILNDGHNTEIDFDRDYQISPRPGYPNALYFGVWITTNGEGSSYSCFTTPARAATWGAVKAQYRK